MRKREDLKDIESINFYYVGGKNEERPLKMVLKLSAHLAMIDTLMMAYTVEMVSIEKVIACAQQYSAFFQATDLPYDIEDAVMYWINKHSNNS
ncbi:Calmodulin-regulated spectrin-associated protein 2 [Saguinus oedipus]|uniref:Calmodulin-regulated spectrin-associated protein 2 n=1 Tax=Saguinus oedipus TaxID=9490 RepID=A0ABQ9TNG3_SAGOE|nr:Calmodulin-regulated spectrin-associated protein 2 [Saguinus oedipus]